MSNEQPSGSGAERNWPVDLSGMVGGALGGGIVLLIGAVTRPLGFWLGLLAFCTGSGVGFFVGRLVGSHVFPRPPASGPAP